VGVLDLVDLDQVVAAGPVLQHLGDGLEEGSDVEDEVGEVDELPLAEAALVPLGGLPESAVLEAGSRPGRPERPEELTGGPARFGVLEPLVDLDGFLVVVLGAVEDPL
jgi:hypothetical protein